MMPSATISAADRLLPQIPVPLPPRPLPRGIHCPCIAVRLQRAQQQESKRRRRLADVHRSTSHQFSNSYQCSFNHLNEYSHMICWFITSPLAAWRKSLRISACRNAEFGIRQRKKIFLVETHPGMRTASQEIPSAYVQSARIHTNPLSMTSLSSR